MFGIKKDNIICPFCGNDYSMNDSKNVTETLVYLHNINDSHSCISIEDTNYNNYPLYSKNENLVLINKDAIHQKLYNKIINHKECFLLFMCKCPRCHKTYSFIGKINRQAFPKNGVVNPFISVITNIITISPMNILPTKIKLPKYIPENIIKDYKEDFEIKNISPQASAMLSRRILEEIISDKFHIPNVDKNGNYITLNKKLNDVQGRQHLPSDMLKTLYSIKTIGNAGAHKTLNNGHTVRIKADTANDLLKLIYDFITEIYINTHEKKMLRRRVQDRANKISKKYKKTSKGSPK